MSGINGVPPGSKPIEVQQTGEQPAPAKTETSVTKEAAKDTFETPKEKNAFDNFASGPTSADKLPPGEARTAKGIAYQKMLEDQKQGPGQARTAKGQAYLKMKESQEHAPGEARTAKGHAYQKMMQAEAANILREHAAEKTQPGDAPRTKKFSGVSN